MVWSCSFHSSFPIVPSGKAIDKAIEIYLKGDGRSQEAILNALPYAEARGVAGGRPDPRRYRDNRQLLFTIGLVYHDTVDGQTILRVTALGKAISRWRPNLTEENVRTIARYASRSLAACQLRNPTRPGKGYADDIHVFPFRFIWQAMLELDGRITPTELNRAIFNTKNETDLSNAISAIRDYRRSGDVSVMGPEVARGDKQNDRIGVWMGWASFGWSLVHGLRGSDDKSSYTIGPNWAYRILRDASAVRFPHRDFSSEKEYVEYISDCAGLPPDLR
jgi:hypothetical protein